MIRGVKIVSIPVRNQDVALKFYTEKIGFKVATDQPFGPGQRWSYSSRARIRRSRCSRPRATKTGLAVSSR
jgi:catechol 2,3-dioxygenase-like lactoylglutathione lyase family enzyme